MVLMAKIPRLVAVEWNAVAGILPGLVFMIPLLKVQNTPIPLCVIMISKF